MRPDIYLDFLKFQSDSIDFDKLEIICKKAKAFDYIIRWDLDIDCILWCYAYKKSYNDYVSNKSINSGYGNEKIFNFILDIMKGMIEDE